MKEKINNWLDTPITWRASCKVCGIVSLISIPAMIYSWYKMGLLDYAIEELDERLSNFMNRFRKEEAET